MTDKQKILQEIERLIAIEEETSHLDKISFNSGRWKVLTQLIVFIDSLPEEPTVKGITWEDVNTLESLIYQVHNEYPSIGEKSFGLEVLERFQDYQDVAEEPASEDLEEEYEKYFKAHETDIVLNPYTNCKDIARHFAEWGRNHFEDKSEMVSEDLEEDCSFEKILQEIYIKYDKKISIESLLDIASHFTEWQKHQMMKENKVLFEKSSGECSKELIDIIDKEFGIDGRDENNNPLNGYGDWQCGMILNGPSIVNLVKLGVEWQKQQEEML